MNQRTARQRACVHAANVIETALADGWDLARAHGYTDKDAAKIEAELIKLIDELCRRAGCSASSPSPSGSVTNGDR